MALTLAASADDRALALRDHLLPLIHTHAVLGHQSDTLCLISLQIDAWLFKHWTPFQELGSDEASSPGYRHALERQRPVAPLPYGLEVWRGQQLLSVVWADKGAFAVDLFVRGRWEDELLKL